MPRRLPFGLCTSCSREQIVERISGKKPEGLPVGVEFEVRVTDQKRRHLQLKHWVYVELSQRAVAKIMNDGLTHFDAHYSKSVRGGE